LMYSDPKLAEFSIVIQTVLGVERQRHKSAAQRRDASYEK
jgi:hypothetical protein